VSLDPIIREIRLLAEAALLRRLNAGSGFADPRVPSQIFLRDPAALARLAGGTLRPHHTHAKAADELAAELAASRARAPRLEMLVERLGLDAGGRILLAIAVAYALDPDTRELCHALAPRGKPALYVETCVDVANKDSAPFLRAVLPGSSLRRARVLAIDGDGLAATLELAPPALAWLLGDDALQLPLSSVCTLLEPTAELGVVLPAPAITALDALVPRLAAAAALPGGLAIALRGPRGAGRKGAAHRLAKALGKRLLVIHVPSLLALEHRAKTAVLAAALAGARLRDALPLLADCEPLFDDRGQLSPEHADAIAHLPGALLAGTTRSADLELRRPVLSVALPRAVLEDRERAWAAALAGTAEREAPELAGRYVLGPGAIAEVVAEAADYARAAGITLDVPTLEASVARRLSLKLGTYGTIVSRKSRFSEMVLPDEVVDTLHDMIAMVRSRSQILERWGYQRHLGISRGVSALFSGEPGTGKTMAASVVASELGLELVRIDLSAVISKYVGETEKNLAKIFDEAQDAHAMLLFDEADSLFGKRTKLESAQDRFANLEVNYILQRMESFDGVSVLTTNAEAAIDPALQRRLNFRLRFPEPEADERSRLWRQLLPPSSGLHDRVDFDALAERFDMTGGYIKNAVVRAAVIAARAGRAMVAEDLWLGAHHEYVEMGKVMPQPSGTL